MLVSLNVYSSSTYSETFEARGQKQILRGQPPSPLLDFLDLPCINGDGFINRLGKTGFAVLGVG